MESSSQQQQAFQALLDRLGQAPLSEIQSVLNRREMVQPEEALSPEVVACLKQRIRDASKG